MKVSAVVSAYYCEDFLEGRIKNLKSQNIPGGLEIICVYQKGSPEEKQLEKHDVIKIETEDIPTIYKAWNLAIEKATGEFITNANSDDRLYQGGMAKLIKALENKDCSVSYGDVDVVSQIDGQPIGRYEWLEGGIEELLHGCFIGPMPMWKRSLHDKYGYFDDEMHSAGDYEFWLRLAKNGEKFYHVKRTVGAYLKRPNSAEHREKLRSIWEQARAKSRYREGVGIWQTPEIMQ